MIRTPADQGRLLFPGLLPLALFVAFSLAQWRQQWLLWAVTILALFTSVFSLLVVLPEAYGRPPTILEQDIPADAIPVYADMGHGLELLAVKTETDVAHSGEWVWVRLYWRANQAPEDPVLERLALYDRNQDRVGWQQNYHGGGTYPANLWPSGNIIEERLGARLSEDVALPTQLHLVVGIGGDHQPIEIARVKAVPMDWPERSSIIVAQLGEGIELATADFSPQTATQGTVVTVNVRWQVVEPPGRDLTTFVHLGDPAQVPLAQADGPPFEGEYPTHFWSSGEVLNDSYTLTVPDDLAPGRYPIHMGMYEPDSGARLPLWIDSDRQTGDAYFLGWLTVE